MRMHRHLPCGSAKPASTYSQVFKDHNGSFCSIPLPQTSNLLLFLCRVTIVDCNVIENTLRGHWRIICADAGTASAMNDINGKAETNPMWILVDYCWDRCKAAAERSD